ncbi:hypothetical protein EGW08_015910 [Elysia chlorotica]|uniref:RING-type domain-containing protein n=1 Tax=Elysia chlorotica TaxID=188477 RepID=A0A3S1BW32_ELYCH|nr:hypothetical protein EGW08_015910 [Elysia chlorotica]
MPSSFTNNSTKDKHHGMIQRAKFGDYHNSVTKQIISSASNQPVRSFDCALEGFKDTVDPLENRAIKHSGAQIITPSTSAAEADGTHKGIPRSQVTKDLTEDTKEYEHQKGVLLSFSKSHNGFLKATVRKAIEFMLDRSQSTALIDIIAAYVYVKLGRIPTGIEVYTTMMDYDFHEQTIVKLFADYVKTESGANTLKSILNCSSFDHQHLNECAESNTLSHSSPGSSTQQPKTDRLQEEKQASNMPESDELHSKEKTFTTESSLSRDDLVKMLVEKENAKLKDQMLCRICKQRQISVVLLPCGHVVLCNVCSEPCQVCPCCQKVVLAEKKIFLG